VKQVDVKPTAYSARVLDHFQNPRNVGVLEGEDVAVGRVGNPVCGDLMEIFIKVVDERIADIKFRTFGCGSAIATSSMITEMAKGKTLDEAMKITRQDVATELEGLPPRKMHCSNLAADALHAAIQNYRAARGETIPMESVAAEPEVSVFAGEEAFLGKGVFYAVDDPALLKDQRVLVLDAGPTSAILSQDLMKYTDRVIFLTSDTPETSGKTAELLKQAGVKVLFQSRLKEIKGHDEVEKVLIHDSAENDDYDLVVDAVVILRGACDA
jgi:FeS cluster assembly scaffold protein NifU